MTNKHTPEYIEGIIKYYVYLMHWIYQVGHYVEAFYLLKNINSMGETGSSEALRSVLNQYYNGSIAILENYVAQSKVNIEDGLRDILRYSNKIGLDHHRELINLSDNPTKNNLFKGSLAERKCIYDEARVISRICEYYTDHTLDAKERRRYVRRYIRLVLLRFYQVLDPTLKSVNIENLDVLFTDESIKCIATNVYKYSVSREKKIDIDDILLSHVEINLCRVLTFDRLERNFKESKKGMKKVLERQAACY